MSESAAVPAVSRRLTHYLIPVLAVGCFLPWVSAGTALVTGLAVALVLGNPYAVLMKRWTHRLLTWSVIGLGASMNLGVVAKVGAQGIGYTLVGISATLLVGTVFARWLKISRDTGLLISVGTAICGGSAIAAVAPTLKASSDEISVSLATVFLLNAAALLIFPPLGHALGLSQEQFGLWSALAIHDTSSVVGAAMRYGAGALAVAVPVKLARALWIVPVVLLLRLFLGRPQGTATPTKFPWFILGFLLVAALVSGFPVLQPAGQWVALAATRTLVLTLFFVGGSVTGKALQQVGARPLIQGLSLWFLVAGSTLAAICTGWIR